MSLWNELVDPVFDGVGLPGFKSRANAFLFASGASYLFVINCFPFLFYSQYVSIVGAGVFGLIGCTSLSPSLALQTSFNNNNSNVILMSD